MSRMLILAAVAAATLAGPAMAYQLKSVSGGDVVRVVTLPTKHVDFNDAAQTKAFYTEIKRAADEACTGPSTSSIISRPDRDCVASAIAQAVKIANRPLLTAAYNGEAGSANRALAGNDQ